MHSLEVTKENQALLTDLYELTMAAAYWTNHVDADATFELYFRRLPPDRSYLLAGGLEQALEYICNLHFSEEHVAWLRSLDAFKGIHSGFWDFLTGLRFTGDVWAIPEGIPVFALEPVIQVRAPLIQSQILETYLLTTLNMQTMIATKAARTVKAAQGRGVVDFGTRRAHGPQAGLLAARASYIGGCLGTSNVLAGYLAGIPVYGTAAHSFTMAFDSELEAFRAYHKVFPDSTVLLIDTYNTIEAAKKVKEVADDVLAVRIDSGDLLALSKQVRQILDADGLKHVKIFVSGDLNEYKISDLLSQHAPIDFFGVGTELVTSYDHPALNDVYKLVEIINKERVSYRIKTSAGKLSYPGRKQVYRFSEDRYYSYDLVSLVNEDPPPGAVPLLKQYIRDGILIEELPDLGSIQRKAREQLKTLAPEFHRLHGSEEYGVAFSESLKRELHRAEKELKR